MLEKLTELNAKLTWLLADPHPELSAWGAAVDSVIDEMKSTLYPDPEEFQK